MTGSILKFSGKPVGVLVSGLYFSLTMRWYTALELKAAHHQMTKQHYREAFESAGLGRLGETNATITGGINAQLVQGPTLIVGSKVPALVATHLKDK